MTKFTSLLLLINVCFSGLLFGQTAPIEFTYLRTFGDGVCRGEVTGMATDSSGNIYAVGNFSDAFDFDPGPGEAVLYSGYYNSQDGFFAKYDSLDNLIWVKQIRLYEGELTDIAVNHAGEVVITGHFDLYAHPDAANYGYRLTTSSEFDPDILLAKYDGSGNFIWAHSFGSPISGDSIYGVAVNGQDEIFITGVISDSVDFDPSAGQAWVGTPGYTYTPYVAKYTSSGFYEWAFIMETTGWQNCGRDIAINPAGEVLVVGRFHRPMDFDPSGSSFVLNPNNSTNGFVSAYSDTGNFLWAFQLGIDGNYLVSRIVPDVDNGFAICGIYPDSLDLDPGAGVSMLYNSGYEDGFVAHYRADRSLNWGLGISSPYSDMALGLDVDTAKNVYVAGLFSGTLNLGPLGGGIIVTTSSHAEGFEAKYDSTGVLKWHNVFRGTYRQSVSQLVLTPFGRTVIGGSFQRNIDLDPTTGTQIVEAPGSSLNFYPWFHSCRSDSGQTFSAFSFDLRRGGDDWAYDVDHDHNGNYVAVGSFRGSIDFDDGPGVSRLTSPENEAGWVAKYHPYGGLDWAVKFEDTIGYFSNFVKMEHVTINDSGAMWITGRFKGVVDFDPSPWGTTYISSSSISPSFSDFSNFVICLNREGILVFAKIFGIGGSCFIYDIKMNPYHKGPVFSGWAMGGWVQLDFTNYSNSVQCNNYSNDFFVVQLDSGGSYKWGGLVGGSDSDRAFSLATDSTGNVYVSGDFNNTVDFDFSPATYPVSSGGVFGGTAGFLVSYDSIGNFRWVNSYNDITSPRDNLIAAITSDGDGNLYAAGTFRDSLDLNPGASGGMVYGNNRDDMFLLALDSTGAYRWGYSFGGEFHEIVGDIGVGDSAVYLVGTYTDTTDFDPGPGLDTLISDGWRSTFISTFDTSGNYLGAGNFRGGAYSSLSVYEKEVVTVGQYFWRGDFDPGPGIVEGESYGAGDIYILHLGPNPACTSSLDTLIVQSCQPYRTPSGYLLSASTVYNDTVHFGVGCDSVFRVEYTRMTPGLDTVVVHGCASYFNPNSGQTLYAEGLYTDTLLSAFGCDSVVTLDVRFDTTHSYQQTTECDSFWWGGQFLYSSGTYRDTLTNILGCDSLLRLDLTIYPSQYFEDTVVACQSYVWPTNGQNYTTTGTYSATLVNSNGCDSVRTLHLTIHQPEENRDTVSSCESYFWPVNGNTYSNSGVYTETFSNSVGCDSTEILVLDIIQINIGVTFASGLLVSNSFVGDYQWIDCGNGYQPIPGETSRSFQPVSSGFYAVIITLEGCVDTSNCRPVTVTGSDEPSENYLWIYPNPTSGEVNIEFGEPVNEAEIRLIDNTGKEILTKRVLGSKFDAIQIPGAGGMYFLEIETENAILRRKAIKQ